MSFIKHFCRLITHQELSDEQVMDYFDIVQSVMPNKLVLAYSDDNVVKVNVTAYVGSEKDQDVYEIVLQEQVNLEEGEMISDLLSEEFDFDFEFETSLEI